MNPETLSDDSTTKIIHNNMKNAQVIHAQSLGPPSSAPKIIRLKTKTEIHPTEVEKKTINEKLSPPAFWSPMWGQVTYISTPRIYGYN